MGYDEKPILSMQEAELPEDLLATIVKDVARLRSERDTARTQFEILESQLQSAEQALQVTYADFMGLPRSVGTTPSGSTLHGR